VREVDNEKRSLEVSAKISNGGCVRQVSSRAAARMIIRRTPAPDDEALISSIHPKSI